MKILLTSLCLGVMICPRTNAQNMYYYSGSGDAASVSNWGKNTDGSGIHPSNFTTASDTFELRNTSSATITSNWNISGTNSRLIIGDGVNAVEFIVPSTNTLNASVIVKAQAVLTLSNSTVPTIDTLYTLSKVIYNASTNQALSGKQYYDLECSGSGSKTTTGDLVVMHQLTVNSTLDLNSTTEDLFGSITSINGSGLLRTTSSGATPIPSGLTMSCMVEFYRNGTQTIPYGHYKSLMVSGPSGTKTVSGGNITVDSLLSISSGTTLALGLNTLDGMFNIISGSGALSTTNASTSPIPENKTWPFTVTYSSSVAGQFIASGIYSMLNITSGTNTNVVNGDLQISDNGTFQVSSGNTLDLMTYNLTFGTAVTVGGAGIIKTQNTSSTPIPVAQTWTQTVNYNGSLPQQIVAGNYNASLNINGGERSFPYNGTIGIVGSFTGTTNTTYHINNCSVIFNGASQSISVLSNFPFYHVLFSGSGTKTISASMVIGGNIYIAPGVIVNMGINSLFGNALTTTGTSQGLLRTQNTTSSPLPANRSWTFRIQFDGTTQTIPAGEYNGGLICAGSTTTKSLTGNVTIADTLTLNNSSQLSIGNNVLTLSGIISNLQNGTVTGGLSSDLLITESPSDAGILLFTQTNDTTRSIRNFTLIRTTGADAIILGNEMHLLSTLSIQNGILNANGSLVFTSGPGRDAQLDALKGTGNISGLVTVQRFIKGKSVASNSRWRYLSSPVTTANFISNNWQKQIHITGAGTGGSACPALSANSNGFDATQSNNPSFYTWQKSTQTWNALPSTTATNLETGKGYRVFYRGARYQGCGLLDGSGTEPNDTLLSATGFLTTGNIQLNGSTDSGGYELLGNPYQATIEWTSPSITKTNLTPTISTFKDNASSLGVYASYTTSPIPDSTNGMSRFIAPGTAFFVQTNANGNGSVTFSESCKTVSETGSGFFKTGGIAEVRHGMVLRIQLLINGQQKDEVVLRVIPGTTETFNILEDVAKTGEGVNQLALRNNGSEVDYSINRIPEVNENLKVYILAHAQSGSEKATLRFIAANTFPDSVDVILHDVELHKTIDLKKDSEYVFNSKMGTSNNNRFYISFPTHHSTVTLISETPVDDLLFQIYPVPATDVLHIICPRIDGFHLYDGEGKQIEVSSIRKSRTGEYEFALTDLPAGRYTIQVISKSKVYQKSFIRL